MMVRAACLKGLLAGVLALVALADQARGQSGALEGVIFSSSDGRPLAGAMIMLDTGQKAKSLASGEYALDDVPPGRHEVVLVAPGCQVSFALVDLEPGERRRVGFEIEFDEQQMATEVRRRSSEGRLLTGAEIADMRVNNLTDILRRVAPGMVGGPAGQPGQSSMLYGRGFATAQGPKVPVIVLDGTVLGVLGTRVLDDIKPVDVAYIEILRGASGGWQYGTGGSGGVIRIQTKRGEKSDAPLLDPELCSIPDWR